MRICDIQDCGSRHYGHGYCDRHYRAWKRYGDPCGGAWVDVEARIRAQTTIRPGGCWHYNGQPSMRYPEVRINGERVGIHVWSYRHHNGPVPDGHQVDHSCRVTHCWNPDHLKARPALDNMRDNERANGFAAQTHCINDHPFDADNTYHYKGRRMCRTCRRLARRKEK